MNGDCPIGSANKAAIEALNGWNKRQDERTDKHEESLDKFTDSVNRILGGMVVASILLIINIFVTIGGGV